MEGLGWLHMGPASPYYLPYALNLLCLLHAPAQASGSTLAVDFADAASGGGGHLLFR